MPVYLLHYSKALGGRGRASARHYLGYVAGNADDVRRRVAEHNEGKGVAKITEAFFIHGAKGQLVRVWPNGDRGVERRLKKNGRYSDYCPLCRTHRFAGGIYDAKGSQRWPQTTPFTP